MDMNTIQKKLNLRTKLENLYESVQDSNVKSIIEKRLKDIESINKKPIAVSKELYEKLGSYNWMVPVNEFLTHITGVLNENLNLYYIQTVVEKLGDSYHKNYYSKALEDLEKLSYLEESDVKNQIKRGTLDEHQWIGEVNNIIKENSAINKKVHESGQEYRVEHPVSPIMIKETKDGRIKSTIFELDGGLLELNSQTKELSPVTKNDVDQEFINLLSLREGLTYKNGSFFMYKGSNTIQIDPDKEGNNKITVNNTELHEENLSSYLETSGIFNISEINSAVSFLGFAHKNIHKLTELDFISSITPKMFEQVRVNFINTGKDMWIHKIDERHNKNSIEKPETAKKAVNEIKHFIGYDISEEVEEKLKKEDKELSSLRERKKDYEDRISFLDSKLNEIEQLDEETKETLEIMKAKKTFEKQKSDFKTKLGQVEEQMGNTEKNGGYVEGKILVELDDYDVKEGDTVDVNATDYSAAGKKDRVGIMLDNGAKTTIKKRFLDVNI